MTTIVHLVSRETISNVESPEGMEAMESCIRENDEGGKNGWQIELVRSLFMKAVQVCRGYSLHVPLLTRTPASDNGVRSR